MFLPFSWEWAFGPVLASTVGDVCFCLGMVVAVCSPVWSLFVLLMESGLAWGQGPSGPFGPWT